MRHKPKPKPEPKQRVRGPTKIRKTEMSRAITAVKDAGFTPRGIEVDPVSGKIRVLFGGEAASTVNSWDEVLRDAENTKRSA